MTDLARLDVYERVTRVEDALGEALRGAGFDTGMDKEGRYFLVPAAGEGGVYDYIYLSRIAEDIERDLFA